MFVVSIAIFIIIILIINILIKRYEKEPLLPIPQKREGTVSKGEDRVRELEEIQTPQEGEKEEVEFPIEQGPLVN